MYQFSQSKEYLARLLANENINVVRSYDAKTAWFDLKSRTMTLPIWETSEEVYDLLTLHEISHALHTPEEGWHDAIAVENLPKSYLNIIEDARIERLITARYAGAARAMQEGYAKMNEQDIFGIEKNNLVISELPLIDRINLYYKLGNHLYVPFTVEERVWLDKIDAIQTWEDVVSVCKELYSSEKEKQSEMPEQTEIQGFGNEIDEGEGDQNQEMGEEEESQEMDEEESQDHSAGEGSESQGNDDEESDEAQEVKPNNQDPLDSITDNAYRENFEKLEEELASASKLPKYSNNKGSAYFYVAETNVDDYLVTVENIRRLFSFDNEQVEALARDLINQQNSIVNNMVKEFEAKKRASSVSRQQYAKTGRLDTKKVHKYKLSEDIFRRNLIQTNGKNHGMIMLFDWSGSMYKQLYDTFVQTLALAMFCRKAGIPFSVQLFSDNYPTVFKFVGKKQDHELNKEISTKDKKYRVGRDVVLLEVLSSNSNEAQFRTDVANFLTCIISSTYGHHVPKGFGSALNHQSSQAQEVYSLFRLSGTPMNSALFLMTDYVKKFKARYNTEITNLLVMTDGDSHENLIRKYSNSPSTVFDSVTGKVYKTDIKYYSYEERKVAELFETNVMFDILRARNAGHLNVIGYYVSEPRNLREKSHAFGYTKGNGNGVTEGKIMIVEQNPSMKADRFFFIHSDSIHVEDEWELDEVEEANVSKVKASFKKHMSGKKQSRVFVSKFIENISRKL